MDKNMKSVLVSHIDLDGYGCNVMAQRYLGRDLPSINVNYDELAEKLIDIPRDYQVFITDLSVPENLKGLLDEFEHIILIDHHKSTRWAEEWGKDNPKVEVFVSEERCATWWFYEYLAKQFNYRDSILDEWAKFVDDYDRYVLQYEESRRLNALFYISNRDRFVSDALQYTPQQVLNNNKERVDRYLEQQREYVMKTAVFTLQHEPYRIVMFFAEKNKSAIAEELIKNDHADLCYGIDLHNMSVSLRSSPKTRLDCSKIAQRIHPEGGGHPNASGASLEDYAKDWLIMEKPKDGSLFGTSARFDMPLNLPVEDLPTYEEE